MSDNADMKMADVFDLPLSDDGADAHDENFNYVLECKSTVHAQYAAHAINNHDNLVKERDEWKKSSEYNYQLYNDLMSTISDKEATLTAENKAMRSVLSLCASVLSKVDQTPLDEYYSSELNCEVFNAAKEAALKLGEGQ